MSRESTLASGRLFQVAELVDTCTVDRATGEVTDRATGEVVKTFTTIYAGACRVKMGAAQATRRVRTIGEEALRIASAELHLPVVGSEGILADDRVTVTACVHDAELVGKRYFVTGEHHGTWITGRRLAISEVLA